jgi:energy-coupling factor transporter transmembrane protein EcfT
MQDPRIRIVAVAILSVSAFLSIHGAVFAFFWWLVFTPGVHLVKKIRLVVPLLLMTAFFSLVLEFFGGNGLSYFIRMAVILLLGMWLYAEQKPGEFLSTSVWLFGDRAGFDLGLVSEMGMQSLSSIIADVGRIRLAEKIKGLRWGVRSLIPSGVILVHGALGRAGDAAELLAIRGYRAGGTLCPEFSTGPKDIVAGLSAVCVVFFALVPVGEFFILYR